MKKIKMLLMVVLAIQCLPCIAQKKDKLYTTSYSLPGPQDIQDAFAMLNVNMFNVSLPVNHLKKYKLSIYIDEYESNMVLKSHKTVWNDEIGANTSAGSNGKLSIIINKRSDTSTYASLKIGGNGPITLIKVSPKYNILHQCNPFKSQTLVPGKNIPILLYGSGWHDPALPPDAIRFCMENELSADFKSNAFKSMPHYYIFSVEINETN
jgi:hypothetical protein